MIPHSRAAPQRVTAFSDPMKPPFDRAATVRRAALDILIWVRIIELRWLARRTAAGELPLPDDDPPQPGDCQ